MRMMKNIVYFKTEKLLYIFRQKHGSVINNYNHLQ